MSTQAEALAALDGVLADWHDDRRCHRGLNEAEAQARREAGDHWSLYRHERNGLLVWKAYRAFRSRGVQVHETVLAQLDEFAARLLQADDAAAMLAALELQPRGKVPAASHLRTMERTRRIVSDVHARMNHPNAPRGRNEAFRAVAAAHGLTVGQVRAMWTRWLAKPKPAARPSRSVFEWVRSSAE